MTDPSARLDEIVARHRLDSAARGRLAALLAVVADDPVAPTSVREPARAVDVHLADSLVALDLAPVAAATSIADLGAGAGFPGLALAAARPEARVSAVESSRRKCAFLERAAHAAALPNARVVCTRAEEWRDGAESCDLVTARALAPLSVVVEYAAPLLAMGGALVAWKGRRDAVEEAQGSASAALLGLEAGDVVEVAPFAGAEHRHLHVFHKAAATPPGYPRRPGAASKRPLGVRSRK
jgi:16S rRNA (guanine527-N7)-methyltransferase